MVGGHSRGVGKTATIENVLRDFELPPYRLPAVRVLLFNVWQRVRSLRDALRTATWPDGRRLMTPLTGVSLMVFFVLACQCMSTIAVVRRESGTWRWPLFMFGYMTALAYGASLVVYQVGWQLGLGVG